jgi:hypothetical protein
VLVHIVVIYSTAFSELFGYKKAVRIRQCIAHSSDVLDTIFGSDGIVVLDINDL